jgi:hypothetical protein
MDSAGSYQAFRSSKLSQRTAVCIEIIASFSICFGVGMRQLAGRSVIPN